MDGSFVKSAIYNEQALKLGAAAGISDLLRPIVVSQTVESFYVHVEYVKCPAAVYEFELVRSRSRELSRGGSDAFTSSCLLCRIVSE